MPATCFKRPSRGAGAIAAALACELAGALRGVACATRAFSRSQRVVRAGRLQMHAQACRTASSAGICGSALPSLLGLLVPYMTLASCVCRPISAPCRATASQEHESEAL